MSNINGPKADKTIIEILESLNGYSPPLQVYFDLVKEFPTNGLGYSQFNEMQLLLGYDRVSSAFFQYMIDETLEYNRGASFSNKNHLLVGVDRFRKLAMVTFGNIKNAFDVLSKQDRILEDWVRNSQPKNEKEFHKRHKHIHSLQDISGKDTYYLGYIPVDNLLKRLKEDPDNQKLLDELDRAQEIIEIGKENYLTYLACDHLDVYIATSMREKEEYFMVNKWVQDIFNDQDLKSLQLRWFDPTQSFCEDRMDKGLFEALMLRRAFCTVYFVQENDTFGKDSELASTLAQGKPVIAFVPYGTEDYVNELIKFMMDLTPEKTEGEVILDKLRSVNPKLAWDDVEVREWLNNCSKIDIIKAKEKLVDTIAKVYDRRASLLSDKHPLGLQVNLTSGVANGVLVVRKLSDCAQLIKRIITKKLEYSLEEEIKNNKKYILLREKISNSVFRLITGDQMLTNTFWNYYINKVE